MPAVCGFVFARATPIYYSGEQICGSVRYMPNKRLPLTAIKLTLVGAGHVEWEENVRAPQSIEHNDCTKADSRIRYSGRQEYYRVEQRLAEGLTLEPGCAFEQQFSFTVPEECAATCKLNHGEVAYQLQLTLQRKSTFNKIYQQRIVIKRRLDLNDELKLKEPYSVVIKDKSERNITFSVPGTGFVPGQRLPYQMTFKPGVEYRQIYINLCQNCIYQSAGSAQQVKEVVRILASQKIQSDQPQREGELRIPLEVPITTTNAGLIHISYHLDAVILTDKRKIWQKLIIPITIGTVALQATATTTTTTTTTTTPTTTTTTVTDLLNENYAHFCYDNFASTEWPYGAIEGLTNDLNLALKNAVYNKTLTSAFYQKGNSKISDKIKLLTFKHNQNTYN